MAKRKKAQPWDAVFGRILSINFPEVIYPPKPTATGLDAAEEELSFKFPASYRAFAEVFGLGGVLEMLDVLPLPHRQNQSEEHWWLSVTGATGYFQSLDRSSNSPAPAGLFEEAVVFTVDGSYHTFVFHPQEITDRRLNECRIYDIGREGDVVAIAASFDGWLRWVDQHHRHPEEEDEQPEFPPVYKPNSVEPNPMWYVRDFLVHKQRPAAPDVALWLASNNHTARDLALAIRDRGQTDTFPILADALQEAGCDNADLLDSCRTGDPDIDGVWVLRVLLGES